MNTSGTPQRDEEEDWKKCLESESCLKKGEMKREIKCSAIPFMGLLKNSIWFLERFQISIQNAANLQ